VSFKGVGGKEEVGVDMVCSRWQLTGRRGEERVCASDCSRMWKEQEEECSWIYHRERRLIGDIRGSRALSLISLRRRPCTVTQS
jgi:hypothetical protein